METKQKRGEGRAEAHPTILVAGSGEVFVQLRDGFPPSTCDVAHAGTAAAALDAAAGASVIVIDAELRGGGIDLCRRLRSDPATSRIPLVLRVASKAEHVQALTDARVLASDPAELLRALRRLCPDLVPAREQAAGSPPSGASSRAAPAEASRRPQPPASAPTRPAAAKAAAPASRPQPMPPGAPAAPPSPLAAPPSPLAAPPSAKPQVASAAPAPTSAEEEGAPVLFRRPAKETGEWLPIAPVIKPDQDVAGFAQQQAAYLDALIACLRKPEGLSPTEMGRLAATCEHALQEGDQQQSLIQNAVMRALVAKDLDRMKALSAAKNLVYDKLQQLRTLSTRLNLAALVPKEERPAPPPQERELSARAATAARAAEDELAAAEIEAVKAEEEPPEEDELTEAGDPAEAVASLQGSVAAAPKKSELTRAAENRATAAAHDQDRKASPRPQRSRGLSAAPSSLNARRVPPLLWIAGLVLLGGIALFVYLQRKDTLSDAQVPVSPDAPVMTQIALEDTAGGIVARAEAKGKNQSSVAFLIRWKVNGKLIDGERTARLPRDFFRQGDTVQAEVSATDSHGVGAMMTSELLRVGEAPKRPAPRPAPVSPDAAAAWPTSQDEQSPGASPSPSGAPASAPAVDSAVQP